MGDEPTESETTATEPPADSYLGILEAGPTESETTATEPPADSYLGNLYPSMKIHSNKIIVCE